MPKISAAKILMIATDGFEDSELMKPRETLLQRGAKLTLASLEHKEIVGEHGTKITPDCTITEADSKDFDALILPGGVKNPDRLRMDEQVVYTVRKFVNAGKPVGAICHAPWLLVEADVVHGRTVTSWPSVRTDLKNAGGKVIDKEAVVDGNVVTSRNPDDIPAFTEAFIQLVEGSAPASVEQHSYEVI